MFKRYIEFFVWLKNNPNVKFDDAFKKFGEVVKIRKNDLFVKGLFAWVWANRERVRNALSNVYKQVARGVLSTISVMV